MSTTPNPDAPQPSSGQGTLPAPVAMQVHLSFESILAVIAFTLGVVLFGWMLVDPNRFFHPVARGGLIVAMSFYCAIFVFVVFPTNLEFGNVSIPFLGAHASVNKITGPIALFIVLLPICAFYIPAGPFQRVFDVHFADGAGSHPVSLVTFSTRTKDVVVTPLSSWKDESGQAIVVEFPPGETTALLDVTFAASGNQIRKTDSDKPIKCRFGNWRGTVDVTWAQPKPHQ